MSRNRPDHRSLPGLCRRSHQGTEARRSGRARQHAVANNRSCARKGSNRIAPNGSRSQHSRIEQLFQAPFLNRLFWALRAAIQPTLTACATTVWVYARTLHLDREKRRARAHSPHHAAVKRSEGRKALSVRSMAASHKAAGNGGALLPPASEGRFEKPGHFSIPNEHFMI